MSGAGPFDDLELERQLEALLFAAAEPLSLEDLTRRVHSNADVAGALSRLVSRYAGRGLQLQAVGERWRFATAPDLAPLLQAHREEPRRLSRAAMETLAVIAYHQPVTRAEIDAVRGVTLGRGTLDVLLEVGWVRLRGRRRSPGRPVTYGTTDAFLEHFSLPSLADLPGLPEMKAAGLLSLDLPPGFSMPTPGASRAEEDEPLEEGDRPEFIQDFILPREAGGG